MSYRNKRNVFLTLSDAGKPKIKVPADSASGEALRPATQTADFFSSHGRGAEGALRGLFYKGANAVRVGSMLMT